ncbi:hypothetical protein BBP40_005927 [Aspergillus hancockii]|nr:hypothetical protein BBP40_005927 [Aspergillus hancockii]
MDTHDVSQFRKGQTPKPTKSRDEIIMQFMFRQMMGSSRAVDLHALRSSFVPPAYYPSVTVLSELKKALINNLTLETHHRGSYILVRAVTPTDRMTAIMAVVEDERGDVLMLQLYNQEKNLATDGRLVEGTVMLIKEPYLKMMADGDYGLRVDHLSDIRLIPDHDPLVPSAAYHLAIDCYSKALDSSPTLEEDLTIRLNRALTCLKTHQSDAALRDVELALSHDDSEKALFRKSQALYYLQRFQESCEVHKVLNKAYPNNTAAKSEFDRATARLAEGQSGEYPFRRLQREATKRRPPLLDRATYIGPVSVRPTESRGRGLFTTEAVRAGELLFCEKAFAHAFHDEAGDSNDVSLLMNTETQTMTMGTQAELISLIAQKLYKNPSLMSTFTDLYHGSYTPVGISEVDGIPVVDTFLVERTMSLNCFGCPVSSRISHICTMKEDKAQQLETTKQQFHSCGIWPLASYINHSCYTNARRSFIGDMMVVRATRDIPANTELTFWYNAPLDHDTKTKHLDLQHWGFQCSCVICQDLHETGNSDLTKRRQLTADLVKAFQSLSRTRKKGAAIAKIEGIIPTLEKTYRQPSSEVPRLGIWKAYLSLAVVHATGSQPRKAIEFAFRTLESLGYVIEGGQLPHTPGIMLLVRRWGLMMDSLVGCWMILCRMYCDVARDLADQAEDYARTTYRICVGEDETFGDTYSRFSDRVDGLIVGVK